MIKKAVKSKAQHSSQGFNEAKVFLEKTRKHIDKHLGRFIPKETKPPVTLHKAMRYSLFAGGKRLRPAFVLAAAYAASSKKVGSKFSFPTVDEAIPAACAMEMIHTYSLIHDDLPSMDDDDLRRGRPTCHKVFGEAMAILAGDGLLTKAFEVIALSPRSDRAGELGRIIAHGAGSQGMVGGQVLDLEGEGKKPNLAMVRAIHKWKTAALIAASCEAGAIAIGATRTKRQSILEFGQNIGMAFQIVDDILDVTVSSEQLGKTAGKDERAGKATYPAVLGLKKAQQTAQRLTNKALNALKPLGKQASTLEILGRFVVDRRH